MTLRETIENELVRQLGYEQQEAAELAAKLARLLREEGYVK